MIKDKPNNTYALLVPCYNAENYISDFISNLSALEKHFDEVLYYDDASSDRTVALLEAHGCTVIRGTQNRGAGYARNCLSNSTTCEWFHFHDIDDGLMSEYLSRTSKMAETGDFDVILCNVNWHDASTGNLSISWKYSDKAMNAAPITYTISHPIGGINGLYRKQTFHDCGGFNTSIRTWEDADLHIKLASCNARFHIIEEVLSYSLRFPASASSNQSLSWSTRLTLLGEYFLQFPDKNVRLEIGRQAQVAASQLVIYDRIHDAKEALLLSERCNVRVPDNHSLIWTCIKAILPSRWRITFRLFQLKSAFRKKT